MDSYSHATGETAEAGKVLETQVLIIQGDDQSMACEGIKIMTSRASLLHYTWEIFFSSFNLMHLKFLLQKLHVDIFESKVKSNLTFILQSQSHSPSFAHDLCI